MAESSKSIAPTFEKTLETVIEGLDKLGSLPIFSASVNRIRFMSSSDETEVMELANEIMKDASLTSRLLKVANSSQYSAGGTKIGTISRAIVVLGYETVKSITMALKVIDSFKFSHDGVDINALLARSFMSAGFVKDVAINSGVKQPEESYICALLHNLGEIIIATLLTDEYLKMKELVKQKEFSWDKAQKQVLGTTLDELAQAVFKRWEFPDTVIKTVEKFNMKDNGPVKDKLQLNRAMASISNNVIGSMYSPENSDGHSYNELMTDLSEATGLDVASVSTSLVESFKLSCDIAEEYGLDKKALQPKISGKEGGDLALDKVARSLSFYVGGKSPGIQEVPVGQINASSDTMGKRGKLESDDSIKLKTASGDQSFNADVMMVALDEITNAILNKSDINSIFSLILENVCKAVGFDRAVLCFLSPDRNRYKARLVSGAETDALKDYFDFSVDKKTDLFSHVALGGEELLVTDIENEKWKSQIRKNHVAVAGSTSFVLAPLKLGDKPVGFVYADMALSHSEITMENFNGFIQLVNQAKLALIAR